MIPSDWRGEVRVRMLVQMFQAEDFTTRNEMVRNLASLKDDCGSRALAQRAVFDLHPAIRKVAVEALKDRPRAEYRSILLDALRYPWPPVAEHAAEALVALKDRGAVPDLVRLLDEPDPQAPFQDKDKKWAAAELVRVNHLGNCVLCHEVSCSPYDPVRGLVPERGKPLTEVYYESMKGTFVRADVTYLKQDFSVTHSVSEPDKWPHRQRFDYMIRKRELRKLEIACLPEQGAPDNPTSYPQREAIVWALRAITGQDAGARSEDWNRFLKTERPRSDP
jgi:hypothetical protein